MKMHYIKTYPLLFTEVLRGTKTFVIRKNDRDYKLGDLVVLQEFKPSINGYTGNIIAVEITYILTSFSLMSKGACVFSFRKLSGVNNNSQI